MPNMEIFLKRLRKAREDKKLSQSELAKKAGFQPSAISHFETGKRSPSFANLKKLADALEVTVDYLLGRAEKPKNQGLEAEALFRDFSKLSEPDRKAIAQMTRALADKDK